MRDVDIYIDDTLCISTGDLSGYDYDWETFECTEPIIGSSITLQNNKDDELMLCGVNVYGE